MSAEFYKYATDKIKKEKQVAKENEGKNKDPPALRRSQRTKKNLKQLLSK